MATNALTFDIFARDRGASRTFSSLGRQMGAMAGVVAGLGVSFGLIKLKDFVQDAAESAKISRITTQVIKSTGGAANVTAKQVDELSQALSNKTAVDDELVQTGANLLLTFKNVRNEAGKGNDIFNQATAAALDLSAAGFGSVESASKMLGKALNDPIAGLTALGRAGVTFTDQQKEQIRTMVEAGDTLGAQRVIMEEVASQVGGAAEAAAGPFDRLKTIAGNLGEEVGTVLLPYLEDFAQWMIDEGVPRVEDFIATIRDDWIPVIEDAIDKIIAWKEEIGLLIGSILGIRTAIIVVQAFMKTNPLGVFMIAVGSLVALFVRLNMITNDWRSSLRILAIATKHIPGIGALLDVLSKIRGVLAGIKSLWERLGQTFKKGWTVPGFGSLLGFGGAEGGKFSNALTGGNRVFPLPPGTYRWGRGPSGHGYDAQDLPVPTGTPVRAPVSGFARGIDLGNRSYGRYVQIASSFGRVILAHMSRLFVGSGFVRAGQLVGLSGSTGNSTGPHLHVEPSRILRFAQGGIIPEHVIGIGMRTGTGYEFGERGPETVIPTGRSNAVQIEIHSGGSQMDDLLVALLRRSIRAKGGNVQLVLGQ